MRHSPTKMQRKIRQVPLPPRLSQSSDRLAIARKATSVTLVTPKHLFLHSGIPELVGGPHVESLKMEPLRSQGFSLELLQFFFQG